MREVPQRLASSSEETPLKKNQISVSITLSNSILNCSTLALFTASVGSLVWGVADNTKEQQKQWGPHSVPLAY